MRTVGIDLAAQDAKTAACAIEWGAGRARVATPTLDVDDDHIVKLIGEASWSGIDAPFGWPDAMVEAVSLYAEGASWPTAVETLDLKFRGTDHHVHTITDRWPLSVSSDRIAIPAWRCAGLLRRLGNGRPIDRAGGDQVVEVYPGAALTI